MAEANEYYWENPTGTQGFGFIEFSASADKDLHKLFDSMGFVCRGKHSEKQIWLYQQNEIYFFVNEEKNGFCERFVEVHGSSVTSFAIKFKDAKKAFEYACARGAKAIVSDPEQVDNDGVCAYCIEGIGGARLYLTDDQLMQNMLKKEFNLSEQDKTLSEQSLHSLNYIDHITHNVYRGNMNKWAKFYEDLFNFRQIRYFEIEGKKTALLSRALCSPCRNVRIPINESADDKSQIAEYLNEYGGEGVQHIALLSKNLYSTVDVLSNRGMQFQDTIDAYYDLVDERLPNHGESVEELRRRRILIDGGEDEGLLLQIFSENAIGPVFFEFIQRKGNQGFGEGNFQALFESIELDQMRRGVI